MPINLGPKAGNGFNPQSFPSDPKVVKFITPMAHKYSKNTLKTINIIKSFDDILNFIYSTPNFY